jgi:hypothetical protein
MVSMRPDRVVARLARFHCFVVRNNILQNANEFRRSRLEFLPVNGRERAERRFALIRQGQEHLSPVHLIAGPGEQPPLLGPVHEGHGAVVLDLQSLGDIANRDLIAVESLDREQELMLLRLEPGTARRFLAEALEPAELVAEFSQRLVIGST